MKQMLKYIYSIIMENVKVAENKHGIILALSGGLIVLTANMFNSASYLVITLNFFVIVFCSISIVFCFLGLFARNIDVKFKKSYNKKANLLYYKDISSFDEVDYIKCIIINYQFPENYQYDKFELDLARNIIVNSKIAMKKYVYFNRSVLFLLMGLIINIALMVVVGIIG